MKIISHSIKINNCQNRKIMEGIMYILCNWEELGDAINEMINFGRGEMNIMEVKDGYILKKNAIKVEE